MKQKNIVIIVVVVLIIAGGLWYMFSTAGSNAKTTGQVADSNSAPVQDTQIIKGTLSSLLAKGGNYTCTLNTIAADGSKTMGTVYASNGKTSFDFRTQDSKGSVTISHTIRNSSLAYSWADGQTKGIKTVITPKSAVPVAQPNGVVVMINDTAQVESDCHPWVPKMSVFTPPVGITF